MGLIPQVSRDHIIAYKEAFEKCDNDPDDDASPEYRGLEAVFNMLRENTNDRSRDSRGDKPAGG